MDTQSTQSVCRQYQAGAEPESPEETAHRDDHDAGETEISADVATIGRTVSSEQHTECGLPDPPESLDDFLRSVERRAFVMAQYALKNEEDSLDTVQDAMLKLCENYADRPAREWGALFYRILHNGITDRRRPRGMNRLRRWVVRTETASPEFQQEGNSVDVMDNLPGHQLGPHEELARKQQKNRINKALSHLPEQQRQVFLLRRWQGLSVRETAAVLNIGEGSVKTHLSRAVSALKERLQERET